MAHANPLAIDGVVYDSVRAAARALHAKGLDNPAMAGKLGVTASRVSTILSQCGLKSHRTGTDPAPTASETAWTETKVETAVRLFSACLEEVARHLAVPSAELRDLWVKGKQPAPVAPEPTAYVPPPREVFEPAEGDAPDRDDDEAELARLQAEEEADQEQEAPAEPVSRFPDAAARAPAGPPPAVTGDVWLKDEMGRFLHESLDGVTSNPRFAWKGDAQKLKAVLNRLPHLRQLDQVPVAR